MRPGSRWSARLCNRQRQCLQPVVLQHQGGNLVGHARQQLDPRRFGQPPGALGSGQCDLDVDLVVRAIDARRVINKVGVDPAAVQCELDPAGLCRAQIGTLADNFDAQINAVDPQAIVGRIADRDVVFGTAFDIGTDPAEPQQINLGLKDCGNQAVGIDHFSFDP